MMKFFTTVGVLIGGLASLVATDVISDSNDYFYGLDATDIAPVFCTSVAEYLSCYRTVSALNNCDFLDDSCFCSFFMIGQSCLTKYCPKLTYDSYVIPHWCNGSATPLSSPAKTTSAPSTTTKSPSSAGSKSSSSSSSAAAASGASASSAKPAAQAVDSSAQATSTASSTAAAGSSSNAGGRSVVVSVGGVVVAVAALAVAGAFA